MFIPVATVCLEDAHFSKFILNHLHANNIKLYIYIFISERLLSAFANAKKIIFRRHLPKVPKLSSAYITNNKFIN